MPHFLQCEVDGDTEYEFSCYNRENFDGLWWNANDARYTEGIFGGVLLKANSSQKLLSVMFPRFQTQLR